MNREILFRTKGIEEYDKDKYIYDELECSYNEEFVKCPYCGFNDYDVYDGLDIDADTYDCPSCGKIFGFNAEQTIEFTSFPIDEKEGTNE